MAEEYPEHEKLKALEGKNQLIGDFLKWLEDKGLYICTMSEGVNWAEYSPEYKQKEDWIAEFFEIDRDELEEEKRRMLDELRSKNTR